MMTTISKMITMRVIIITNNRPDPTVKVGIMYLRYRSGVCSTTEPQIIYSILPRILGRHFVDVSKRINTDRGFIQPSG